MLRRVSISCAALTLACQLPHLEPVTAPESATPAQQAPQKVAPAGPLPAEETPPPEEAKPPAEAKPLEPGITTTGAPTRGTLPKAVVDEKLKSAQPGIQRCYEGGLASSPDLRGTVNINFVVGVDGKVAHAEALEAEDSLKHEATVNCVLTVIKNLEFPKPSGGRVFLNYPVKFEASKPAAP